MSEIKIKKISIKNFKGTEELIFDPEGKSLSVYGKNGLGKTTIQDAFAWCLFDKDSLGASNFEIKPIVDGVVVNDLESEVILTLNVDGKEREFGKKYYAKFTKKRGSAIEEFTGNTTDYYVDSVPIKKKDYVSAIAEVLDEEVFKLTTDPNYFNSLHWKKKRDMLLEICGDVSDDDVINSNEDLKPLKAILDSRKAEQHKAIIAGKMSEINKELKNIPARITENKNMKNKPKLTLEEIAVEKTKLEAERDDISSEIVKINSGSMKTELQKKLSDLEVEKSQNKELATKNLVTEKYSLEEKKNELGDKYQFKMNEVNETKSDIINKENEIKDCNKEIDYYRNELTKLTEDLKEWRSKEFPRESTTCVTCNQELPKDKVDELVNEFNIRKSKNLESIKNSGKPLKQMLEEYKAKLPELEKDLIDLQEFLTIKQNEAGEIKAQGVNIATEIKVIDAKIKDYTTPEKFAEQEQSIKARIKEIEENQQSEIDKLNKKLIPVTQELENLESMKASYDTNKKCDIRIKELGDRERELAAMYEQLESELFLVEEFTKTKVNLLDDKINSKFKMAKFKMFNQQVNGGIDDTCETTYNGVPYNNNLNPGHKILVGLDIIKTLQEHYGVNVPVFVDNAERLSSFPEMNCQVIRLVVSQDDKLRVEYE